MTEADSGIPLRFRIILLLGSFDPETKRVLLAMKEALSAGLMSEPGAFLVLLVDDVELYKVDVTGGIDAITIIAERIGESVSLFLSRNGRLEEAFDEKLDSRSTDSIVAEYSSGKAGWTTLKLPILEKVESLAGVMTAAFILRHQELTRGGEYIELAYLIGADRESSAKIWFFKREGVDLSQMAWEILDKFGVQMRPYRTEAQLLEESVRVARYQTRRVVVELT